MLLHDGELSFEILRAYLNVPGNFAWLVRCSAVCKQWRVAVRDALSARYVTTHDCYQDKTLDDIHAQDSEEGLLEWLYMTRPTQAELLRLGGAAFSAIRKLPFFKFSNEDIVAAMMGRYVHCIHTSTTARKHSAQLKEQAPACFSFCYFSAHFTATTTTHLCTYTYTYMCRHPYTYTYPFTAARLIAVSRGGLIAGHVDRMAISLMTALLKTL